MNKVYNSIKMNIDLEGLKQLEELIEDLQKKAELGEHYKHLYSEVKKQKDDVVEYIKKENEWVKNRDYKLLKTDVLLRMLGEIDD